MAEIKQHGKPVSSYHLAYNNSTMGVVQGCWKNTLDRNEFIKPLGFMFWYLLIDT